MHYSGSHRSRLYPQKLPPLIGRLKYSTQLVSPSHKKVLVVGDSYGWYADFALKNKATLVHSLDIAPPAPFISQLRKKHKNFAHFQESILSFRSPNHYDLCIFLEVIEHLPPNTESSALQTIFKHLNSNGVLSLSTPSQRILSYLSDPAVFLGHRHYSEKKLDQLLRSAGFKKVKFTSGGGVYGAIDLLGLYFTKWILMRSYQSRLVKQVNSEYPLNGGTTLFAICHK